MPNRILALDLGGAQLVAVLVETSFRGYQIVGYHAEPRDAARPLGDQLKDVLVRHPMQADTVLTALPGNAAAYRILELPFRDRRKLEQTIPFELESQVPFAVEDAVIDFQVLSRSAEGSRVFAALAPRERVGEHLKALAVAGLDPAVVDFAPLTTLNVLQLFDGDRPERYAFVHVSAGQATLALYAQSHLQNLRVLDVSPDSPGASLAREIRWSLASLNGATAGPGGESGAGLPMLLGGVSKPDVVETLRRELGFVVQRLEELPLRRVPAGLQGRQGTFAPALGLALREIADAPTLGLNFRRDEFAYSRGQEQIRDTAVRLGIVAAVVFVLFLVSQLVSLHQLRSRQSALEGVLASTLKQILPNAPALRGIEVDVLTQEVEKLKKQQQMLGFGPSGPVSALDTLRQISERMPQEPRTNVDLLELSPERVHLKAKTASFDAVEKVRRAIAESPLFGQVQVKDPRTAPDGTVEFHLNLTYAKPR